MASPQRDEFLGRDARTTLTTLELGIDDGTAKRVLPEVERGLSRLQRSRVAGLSGGPGGRFGATNEVGAAALTRVELILFPLVVAILLILYRSVAAALISLVVSVTAIVIAMGVLTWLAGIVELNVVVQSIATMLGLGVSVDYSLIMIRRFIDELTSLDRGCRADQHHANRRTHRCCFGNHSRRRTGDAAHRRLAGDPFDGGCRDHRRRGGGPHMSCSSFPRCCTCSVLAWRLGACRGCRPTRERARRRWGRFARVIMARPVAALAITSAALLAIAVPALGLQTGSGDASVLPKSSSVREGYDLVEEQYGKGAVEPILVVIEAHQPFSGTDDFTRVAAMTTGFSQLDHVARVASPIPVLEAVMPADPFAALEPANLERLPTDTRTIDRSLRLR